MKKLHSVPLDIRAEIGSSMVRISRLLKVGRGGIIPLDRSEDDPIMLKVGKILVADGVLEVQERNYVVKVSNVYYRLDVG